MTTWGLSCPKPVSKKFFVKTTFSRPNNDATSFVRTVYTFRTASEQARNVPERESPTNFSLLIRHYYNALQTKAFRRRGAAN